VPFCHLTFSASRPIERRYERVKILNSTLGGALRQKRWQHRLEQNDVARILGVSKDLTAYGRRIGGGQVAVTSHWFRSGWAHNPSVAGPNAAPQKKQLSKIPNRRPPECDSSVCLGRRYLGLANHLAIFPGAAIMAAVMGFKFLGDGLIDALDPKYRKQIG